VNLNDRDFIVRNIYKDLGCIDHDMYWNFLFTFSIVRSIYC